MELISQDLAGFRPESQLLNSRIGACFKDERRLLDALPAAIYTTDAAGRITYYNHAALELAGRRPKLGWDEGNSLWPLYRPDGALLPHDERPMAIALKDDRPVRGAEVMAERPDGTRVSLLSYPTPLRDQSGALVGAVNMLVDVSIRRDAESMRRDAEARLQEVLFDELNHRTKNNMQILQSLLLISARGARSPEARAVLAGASQRVAAMVVSQTMLYHAGNVTECSAKELIETVCTGVQRALGKNLAILYEPASGQLPRDAVIPLALILNELLTNAVKYGVNCRGETLIKVQFAKEPGSFVLTVEDDGLGFELEEACRRSSGLGLVIGLAKQLGGDLEVQRIPKARCTVRFPQRRPAECVI